MPGRNREDGEKYHLLIVYRQHYHISYFVKGCGIFLYVDRADFRFLRPFREHSELCKRLDDMLARANSVCLLALSRSDERVLALLPVRVDGAVLCCAVLCCACGAKKAKKKQGHPTKNIVVGNYRLRGGRKCRRRPPK